MNEAHKLGKLKNRLSRCTKRLADKEIPMDQRARISQRQAELNQLLRKTI